MMSAWTKFRSKLRAFRAAQAGNVAIIFALASIPIIAFVGAAVDYSRANSVKAAMQGALDSTALMMSKEASTDTSTQLQTNATNYFKALFTRTEATNVQITATYNPTSATAMLLNATASVPTYLTRHHRHQQNRLEPYVDVQVGRNAAARGAGARQHRIDGAERQDDRADCGNQEPAWSVAGCRQRQRRRLCLNYSVREGRQFRPHQL